MSAVRSTDRSSLQTWTCLASIAMQSSSTSGQARYMPWQAVAYSVHATMQIWPQGDADHPMGA